LVLFLNTKFLNSRCNNIIKRGETMNRKTFGILGLLALMSIFAFSAFASSVERISVRGDGASAYFIVSGDKVTQSQGYLAQYVWNSREGVVTTSSSASSFTMKVPGYAQDGRLRKPVEITVSYNKNTGVLTAVAPGLAKATSTTVRVN